MRPCSILLEDILSTECEGIHLGYHVTKNGITVILSIDADTWLNKVQA